MQAAVLESLLINHPLDCPICDQAGECKLQEFAIDYGKSKSAFIEEKVHKPKQVDLGPRIMLDNERCILCTRCIRFTRDIAGDDALGIVNRGSYNAIAAYPGMPFDNNYTLNTVDICPVGALTSKDFRFQMRVWFLREAKSICTSCATGCNIVVGSRENKVYRYEPRENETVNQCWMCDYGRLNYKWVNSPERLVALGGSKVMRQDTMHRQECLCHDWPTVLREIADAVNKAPAGSIAIIASARQSNEELFLIKKLAVKFNAITDSIPRTDKADSILLNADRNPNSNGAKLMGIAATPMGSNLPKIAEGIRNGKIKTLIVIGEDVTKYGIGADLLGKLQTLIVSDILPNKTTALAHYLLPGCAHLEKRGSFVNAKGRVQRFMQAIDTKGNSRAEAEFLGELAGLGGANIEKLFNQMAQEIPAFNGLTWGALGDEGVTIQI